MHYKPIKGKQKGLAGFLVAGLGAEIWLAVEV
jgi:hypothetical protein